MNTTNRETYCMKEITSGLPDDSVLCHSFPHYTQIIYKQKKRAYTTLLEKYLTFFFPPENLVDFNQ